MRIIASLLVLAVLISVPLEIQASPCRNMQIMPSISYSGNVATCEVIIDGDNDNDYIVASVKLWRGDRCLKTWEKTGYGMVSFCETAGAVQGNTYTLTVDYSVNGVQQQRVSFTKKYT